MIFNISKQDKNKSGVYIIKSIISNDFYIGSTKNFYRRKCQHECSFNKKEKRGLLNKYAIEHGSERLKMSIIILADVKHLNELEYMYIRKLNPTLNLFKKSRCHLSNRPNRKFGKNGWSGKKHLQKSIDKIRNSAIKKPVVMMDVNGDFIEEFNSIAEACLKFGFKGDSHISACCKGKKETAYGYKWKYKIESGN